MQMQADASKLAMPFEFGQSGSCIFFLFYLFLNDDDNSIGEKETKHVCVAFLGCVSLF